MSRKIKIGVIILSLLFALGYDLLFPSPDLGINFGVFILAFLVAAILLKFSIDKKTSNLWSLFFCVPILWYAGCVAVYQSLFVHVVAPLASIFLLILFLFWFGVEDLPMKKVKRILPLSLILFVGRFFSKISAPFSGIFKLDAKKSGKVIVALIILVPLLFIFGALFISADLIFREWIKQLFDASIDVHNTWRVVRTIGLFLFFGGLMFAFIMKKRFPQKIESEAATNKEPEQIKRDSIIANIILGVLNLFFLLFIVIQVMFLFGGHDIIKKYDITYADYVHQGFYQMCAIAVLVLIISYIMFRMNRSEKFDTVKLLNSVFIIQSLIIVSSALKRLFLYQEAYGLTQLRFLVWHFTLYIGLILLSLALIIVFKKHYRLFVKVGLVISTIYLMFMTGINMQARIAKVNIDRYLSGQDKEIDMSYLLNLSVDISEQMKRLKNDQSESVRDYYQRWRDSKDRRGNIDTQWQNYTLTEIKFWRDIDQ
ncbi:MAG: DUF4153 domain-containing protein [Patescibacteria group bacterium]